MISRFLVVINCNEIFSFLYGVVDIFFVGFFFIWVDWGVNWDIVLWYWGWNFFVEIFGVFNLFFL